MTALDRAIASQRAESLRIERASQRRLTDAYKTILARLQSDLDALTTRIAAAQAAGETVGAWWLSREERARALMAQTEAEIARFGRYAEQTITQAQRAAVLAAIPTSEAVMFASLGTAPPGITVAFNRLPTAAVEELVGNLADGKPLSDVLNKLGKLQSQAVRQALIVGLGTGEGPRAIARRVREQFISRDGTLRGAGYHALRVSRQEVNRAYRDAGLANLRQNADVCSGWTWLAAGGPRTCAACYAKHGTVHKLSDPFQSHVCCRCACVPLTKSWAELGFGDIPDTRPEIPDRETLFGRLSEDEQRSILGVSAFDLWQAGSVALEDFATPTRSRVWGGGIRQTRLSELEQIGAQEAAD